MFKIVLFVACLVLICTATFSQVNISGRILTVSGNFSDNKNSAIYLSGLNKSGSLTFEPGIVVSAEFYGTATTSLKISQSVSYDAVKHIAASTQAMLRFRLFKVWKHHASIGIGPSVFYRQSWELVPGYIRESGYKQTDGLEYAISWLSGELEYNFYMSKHTDISLAVNHLKPTSAGITLGLKYWISRKSSRCNTCPSFH